ncbi:uncharacterized protein LOC111398193 [Olea europaea var. sylvestris]|uniref:uncharacterized protein LOC111398193 n=1 Tax=Olea europaea var. sylvestris TaxID=158386 RepID=UPI000C1D090E|nr:uncharacterized protein LOC111398193 [Olea europaea var. sylvestris]
MLVKSLEAGDHITHFNSTFQILRRYRMRLNPLKCAFGVAFGKFLGYKVNQRGIEANPEKIEALCKIRSPQKPKEVQSLTGRVSALSRFVSKATDKCLPFFKVLKVGKKFQWNEECEDAFQGLKRHLGQAPILSKPKPSEILQLYLAVSNEAISAVLTREEGTTQLPVYYTSKALLSSETRYPNMEKLALALITTFKKLRPYFQAHTIHVLTNFPLRQVLQNSDALERLLKWAVELSEFDLVFKARAAIKSQALADFVAEFANLPEVDEITEQAKPPTWNLFVDGSAGDAGSGTGVVLISPEGHKLTLVVRFGFKATNNVAQYESLLAGLRLAKEMQVKRPLIGSDSQLVVNQVNGNFSARDKTVASYLKMVMSLIPSFEKFEFLQIHRIENAQADALSKLVSSKNFELLAVVPIEHLLMSSTEAPNVMWVTGTPTWMQPIVAYLKHQVLPTNRHEAYKLKRRSAHFLFIDDVLYIKTGVLLAYLKKGALEFVQKCDKCQRFSPVQRQPSQDLTTVSSPWPVLKWGVNLIGPLPKGRGGASFAIEAIDYFTKLVEVESLAKITEANTSKFLWKNIIRRFGISYSIVSNNGRQFGNKKVRSLCEELGIKKYFSTPHHPQANGQVEAVNKTIKHVLKRKLDVSKGPWVDELPQVLWTIRTTTMTPTGETPFLMAYGTEAMSLVEVGLPSPRRLHFSDITNDELHRCDLDFTEERRDDAQLKLGELSSPLRNLAPVPWARTRKVHIKSERRSDPRPSGLKT